MTGLRIVEIFQVTILLLSVFVRSVGNRLKAGTS